MIFNSKVVCQKCATECEVVIDGHTIDSICNKCNDIPVGFQDVSYVIDYVYYLSNEKNESEYWND